MKTGITAMIASAGMLLGMLPAAEAHVSFVNSRAPAGTNFIATANVGHGCEPEGVEGGLDNTSVVMVIPAGITSFRPIHSTFGLATVDGNTITWTANEASVQPSDTHYHQVSFRFSVPNAPFTSLFFDTTQFCGEEVLAWKDESPVIAIVPGPRAIGWNKYTAQSDILAADFATYFGDAEIVWTVSPAQAYSANPHISALIQNPLTIIPAGASYWVKY